MRYKLFGKSGLKVSELCLGTMTFGEDWGFGAGRDECKAIFSAFRDAGGNFIDTANAYTNGTSEQIVGELVAGDRDRFVVATKYSLMQRPGDPNSSGNHRKSMVTALDASLRRLGMDYVDIYWVHAADGVTPLEELMRALDDMVRAGKVLYVGVSDMPAWQVSYSVALAELRGWSRFVGLQIEYSLLERTVERELTPMARQLDLAVAAWAPLAGGVLTGKYSAAGAEDSRRLAMNTGRITERKLAIAGVVGQIAADLGRSPAQVALNWLRAKSGVVIPIIGARKLAQIRDSLGALEFRLDDEQVRRLDEASAIELGFPHDFLRQPYIDTIVRGDTWSKVDVHRPL